MLASPNELRYFLELCHTLNFSRASERIGISQPSLSAAIQRLEHNLGSSLFIRSKTGVKLTQAGKKLQSHANQLLQYWQSVKSETLASQYDVQGSYILGCHASVALHSVPGFLPPLLKEYPNLEIKLQHDLSRKIVEGVINLSIDMGIVVNPIKHPDLIMLKLYDDKVCFWQANTKKNQIRKIYDSLIICDPELIQTQWLLKRLQKLGMGTNKLLTTSSLELIANLTINHGGIGIIPTSVAKFASENKLVALQKLPSYHDEIYLIYRHENRHIKAISVLVKTIKSYFKQ